MFLQRFWLRWHFFYFFFFCSFSARMFELCRASQWRMSYYHMVECWVST